MPVTDLSDHTDFLTSRGARAIADHINTYWREQGVAGIVAYPVQRLGSDGEWDVRSNMVDGKAPKVAQSTVTVAMIAEIKNVYVRRAILDIFGI